MNWYLAYHHGKKPKLPQIRNIIHILYNKKKKKNAEPAPKRACYSLNKSTKKIRTTQQENDRNKQGNTTTK